MLYKTHKAGGTVGVLVLFRLLMQQGLLVTGIPNIIQFLIMYPAALWGSTAPDLDHSWNNVKEKTPLNWCIHRVLHVLKPRHRSWQTHSIGLFIIVSFVTLALLEGAQTQAQAHEQGMLLAYFRLVFLGIIAGWGSHLVLDALTPGGIYVLSKRRFRLVPRSSIFATGGKWESAVFFILCISSIYLVFLFI